MEISNHNICYKSYNPAFKACGREVRSVAGKFMYLNDTSMFRPDLGNWDRYIDYLGNKYKNAEKVNIYSISSSAGDEVYAKAMKLIEKLGDKGSKKFFPIHASDCDEKIINMAQKGYLPMYEGEEELINKHTNGKFSQYFEKLDIVPGFIKDMNLEFDFVTKVKPILRDKVVFSVADAAEKCRTIEPDNSVVMARNFWPYLKDESTRVKLAEDLYKSLGENSAVVLGKLDDNWGAFASKNIQDAGFVYHPDFCTVYEKNKIPAEFYGYNM